MQVGQNVAVPVNDESRARRLLLARHLRGALLTEETFEHVHPVLILILILVGMRVVPLVDGCFLGQPSTRGTTRIPTRIRIRIRTGWTCSNVSSVNRAPRRCLASRR